MNADEVLKHDIEQALLWDRSVDARYIKVTVYTNCVVLSGCVPNCAQKLAALHTARTAGRRDVDVRDLAARATGAFTCADAALAAAIHTTLDWQDVMRGHEIAIDVRRGRVTLTGRAKTGNQRDAAERLVRGMSGVVEIVNGVDVVRDRLVDAVERNIAAALRGCPPRELCNVDVDVRDGVARLTGTVGSLEKKAAASSAAWDTKGVRWVIDDLIVDQGQRIRSVGV
ncbi:BON domain-containing protein [Paraburkholderia graminis]|uniref:Osmotically-inducible protein OsmY n=1 Tax=Paraburkholderia graminis TaxID=60548 RepID=A0ABD5CFA1_9BURK|nr:BON domain-containing protein [Paraburkholderia graminis]MDR6203919.1 osmotically-inducible protein OsmY [Paraburkholderia graminis]